MKGWCPFIPVGVKHNLESFIPARFSIASGISIARSHPACLHYFLVIRHDRCVRHDPRLANIEISPKREENCAFWGIKLPTIPVSLRRCYIISR